MVRRERWINSSNRAWIMASSQLLVYKTAGHTCSRAGGLGPQWQHFWNRTARKLLRIAGVTQGLEIYTKELYVDSETQSHSLWRIWRISHRKHNRTKRCHGICPGYPDSSLDCSNWKAESTLPSRGASHAPLNDKTYCSWSANANLYS